MAAETSIITRDVMALSKDTGNVYKAIVIMSKRARQVSAHTREELNTKLSEFASSVDNLEEIFENREQIEISKYYEKMPKPTAVAIDEFEEGKVMVREAFKEEQEGLEV